MSTHTATRQGDSWEERVRQLVSMIEETMEMRCPNPEDVALNVVCNGCGIVAVGTLHQPPTGWDIGGFGENDYCPRCRV